MKNHISIAHKLSQCGYLLVLILSVLPSLAQAQVPTSPYNYSRSSSFTYDPNTGLLLSETVEPNNPNLCVTTTYTYDSYGNKVSASTANCSGASGQALFQSRSSHSAFATQTATVKGTTVTIPAGSFPSITTNALNQSETKSYDPRFGAATNLVGPNGLSTSWQLDDFGRIIRETRADGNSTVTYYCLLSSVNGVSINTASNSPQCPSPSATEIPALAASFIHSEPHNTADTKNGVFSRVYMDAAGRKIRTVTEAFDGTAQNGGSNRLVVQDTDYNDQGAVIVSTQPYFLDSGLSTATTSNSSGTHYGMSTTSYDVLGRPTTVYVTDAQGSQSGIRFGSRGSFTASATQVSYSGLTTITTNDKNQTRQEEKNIDGKLVRVTDATGAQIAHQYDAFGNLIQTKDALQNIITISYDIRGHKVSMTDPDTGTWLYTYDALGQLKTQRSANQIAQGTTTTMTYDVLGRMTQRVEPEYTSTWSYDTYANGSSCNKGIGKLCESNTSNGLDKQIVYDSYGRPINTRATVTNGPSFATQVAYDTNGRVITQTYPTGVKVNYAYTNKGYLAQLTLGTAATVNPLPATAGGNAGASITLPVGSLLWSAGSYNAWGKAEKQSYGNGIISQANFDGMTGRVMTSTAGLNGATNALNYSYAWDSLNHLTGRTDGNGDGTTGAVTDSYVYDSIGRLQSYSVASATIANLQRTVTLEYNALGMTLYKSDVGVYSYQAQGGSHPHALKTVAGEINSSYTYDNNGNLIAATAGSYRSISYTSFNLPDSNTGIKGPSGTPQYTWQYDENHQRIKETRVNSTGTRTVWMLHPDNAGGLGFESETGANGIISNRHFITVGGNSIGMLVSTGALPTLPVAQFAPPILTSITLVKVEYWHKDHLGSLVATTDHTGAVTARYEYDPFGKRRTASGQYDAAGNLIVDWSNTTNNGDQRGYTGHEQLDDVGIIHMNGRIYDPLLGVFMQPDPLIQDQFNLQNFNRYGYCYNNPMTCTDPSGMDFWSDIKDDIVGDWKGLWHNPSFRMVASIAAAYFLGPGENCILSSLVSNGYAQAAIAGFVSGTISAGNVKGGLQGALTSMAFYGIGQNVNGYMDKAGNITNWGKFAEAVALHGVVGCVSSVAAGNKCGPGFLSAAFSQAALPLKGNNPIMGILSSMVIGGTASVLGGGKFSNGAETAAFGYLFNCLAHECLSKYWDHDAPGYHSYSLMSPILCNIVESGCVPAAQNELLCDSAPGQSQCAKVGVLVQNNLTGGNNVTQYAFNPNLIVNGTSDGHLFEDGYVMRSIQVDSLGNVRILTYGEGVNIEKFGLPASDVAALNIRLGIALFQNIGVQNQLNVRNALSLHIGGQ